MNYSKAVIWLSSLIAVLALVAAGIGLFWQNGGSTFSFTTLHGQTVQVYGQGLYHYDTVASASQEKGQDVVTLFLGIPLLTLIGIGMVVALLRTISEVSSVPQTDLCDGPMMDEQSAVTHR